MKIKTNVTYWQDTIESIQSFSQLPNTHIFKMNIDVKTRIREHVDRSFPCLSQVCMMLVNWLDSYLLVDLKNPLWRWRCFVSNARSSHPFSCAAIRLSISARRTASEAFAAESGDASDPTVVSWSKLQRNQPYVSTTAFPDAVSTFLTSLSPSTNLHATSGIIFRICMSNTFNDLASA